MKILIIRRDNIGDLVCTTPLLRALRQALPAARLCVLVNSYNAGVVDAHPDVDEVYVYTKLKHRLPQQSRLDVIWQRWKMYRALRRERFDYAIVVGSGYFPHAVKLAKAAAPRHIISFVDDKTPADKAIDFPLLRADKVRLHEVEDIFRLLAPLGISGSPPPLCVAVDPLVKQRLAQSFPLPSGSRVAIHLSAREKSRRWPIEHYRALIEGLIRRGFEVMVLWSPGSVDDPRHPGDDELAQSLLASLPKERVLPCPTGTLKELTATLSLASLAVCPDGGTMHLAAAVGLRVVGLFEHLEKKTQRWYPWGVPHKVVTSGSDAAWQVEHIPVQAVFDAVLELSENG